MLSLLKYKKQDLIFYSWLLFARISLDLESGFWIVGGKKRILSYIEGQEIRVCAVANYVLTFVCLEAARGILDLTAGDISQYLMN